MSQLSEKKVHKDSINSPMCTICGVTLSPKQIEKYQLRWENKNSGACQRCVVRLRKQFKTHRQKTPIKYRRPELFLEDQDIAQIEIDDIGNNYLGVLMKEKEENTSGST